MESARGPMALGAQQNSLKLLFVGRGLLWTGIGAMAELAAERRFLGS